MWGMRGAVVVAAIAGLAACGQPGTGAQPLSPEASARARAADVSPEMVYLTDAQGYSPAAGGAGAYGDDGFQIVYSSAQDNFWLTVERRSLTAQSCPGLPIPGTQSVGAKVTCTQEDGTWERTDGDREEFAVTRDGLLIRVSGSAASSADLLRDAAGRARPATSEEILGLFPPAPQGTVQRGDITGDNAPDNHVGAGG